MQLTYEGCVQYILEKFKHKLREMVPMDPEESGLGRTIEKGDAFSDLQSAYGLLLSACQLKGTSPPSDLSTVITILLYIH